MADPITGKVDARSMAVLKRLESIASPRSARLRRIIQEMDETAAELERQAKIGWPVSRDTTGAKDEKTRGTDREHSIDQFTREVRLTGSQVRVVVGNTARYGYYIRSNMVGESDTEQRRRYFWRKGTPVERYVAQTRVGRKKHAFTLQLRRPAKKLTRLLVRELEQDLVEILREVL